MGLLRHLKARHILIFFVVLLSIACSSKKTNNQVEATQKTGKDVAANKPQPTKKELNDNRSQTFAQPSGLF